MSLLLHLVVALWPSWGEAGGILHVFPPSVHEQQFAVARPVVLLSRTLVTVSENSVEYRVDQTFLNDNEFAVEGLFIFPVDSRGHAVRPEISIDGTASPSEALTWNRFWPLLRELTVSMGDPSLLGLAGRDVLVVRPIRLGVREQRTFRIQWSIPSGISDDHIALDVGLDGERYSLGPVQTMEILVRFKLSRNIRTVFSDTHPVTVLRESPHRCLVTARGSGRRVRDDFRLLATFSGKDLNLRVFCEKSAGQPGYFIAFVEPAPAGSRSEESREKDVVFLLDSSGSMGHGGIDLARSAVLSALDRLGPRDRFNVIAVGTRPVPMAKGLLLVSAQNLADAVRFVNSQRNEGGTDLCNGLMQGLESFQSHSRTSIILLAGDGRATVGITAPEAVVDQVSRHNKAKTRILAVALGDRADVALLDKLAVTTRGASVHLAGPEDLDSVIGSLFSHVAPAKATGISLECEAPALKDVLPSPVPDLVGPESLVLVGRYDTGAEQAATVRLKARAEGRPSVVAKDVVFPEVSTDYPYVPRLWAMRQMAQLLERTRLKGPTPETKAQMETLSSRHGFALPASLTPVEASARPSHLAIDTGRLLWNYKRSFIASEVASDRCRSISGKVFCYHGTRWVDGDAASAGPPRGVRFLGDEYFSLLKERPYLGRYLSLGPEVTLKDEDRVLQVNDGK